MTHSRYLVALVVLLAVVPAVVGGAVVGHPVLSASSPTGPVTPGEETTLQVTILNAGNVESGSLQNPTLTQRVTTARALNVTVAAGDAPIEVLGGTRAVGSLPEGATPPLSIPISVDENADPGTYTVPVTATYTYTEEIGDRGQEEEVNVTKDLSVRLRIDPGVRFEIQDVDSGARLGTTGTVDVTIRNTGGAQARDASLALTSQAADLALGQSASSSRYVGVVDPGESKTVPFEVTAAPTATTQRYAMQATGRYEDEDGVPASTTPLSLGVTPLPEQSFSVGNVSSDLQVGAEGTLEGTITNAGETDAENLVVTFTSQQPTVTPIETEYPVGNLTAGESAGFGFPIEISEAAEAGPKQFSLVATYRDDEGDKRRSDAIDVRAQVARDTPTFALGVDGASVEAGGSTEFRVTVTNAGNEPVSDVSAKLFANDPLSTTDSEAYVDELGAGESTKLTFGVGAGGGALAKTYPLEMDFQYDDADGDTITSQTYRVPIDVTASEGGGIPIAFVAVPLVGVGIAAWWGYRRYGR